jgi:hypothetical protein
MQIEHKEIQLTDRGLRLPQRDIFGGMVSYEDAETTKWHIEHEREYNEGDINEILDSLNTMDRIINRQKIITYINNITVKKEE